MNVKIQNLRGTVEAVLRGIFRVSNTYIGQEKFQLSDLCHLVKNIEKEE